MKKQQQQQQKYHMQLQMGQTEEFPRGNPPHRKLEQSTHPWRKDFGHTPAHHRIRKKL